ncbi:hypothetical protein ACFU5K_26845, partial [Streptomyces sp. NPDC057428]
LTSPASTLLHDHARKPESRIPQRSPSGGGGVTFASHVNDGGFWMVSKYFGITERDTLKSWTVLETVLSVAGFVVAAALSLVI